MLRQLRIRTWGYDKWGPSINEERVSALILGPQMRAEYQGCTQLKKEIPQLAIFLKSANATRNPQLRAALMRNWHMRTTIEDSHFSCSFYQKGLLILVCTEIQRFKPEVLERDELLSSKWGSSKFFLFFITILIFLYPHMSSSFVISSIVIPPFK